ncbi:MAG: hypothetical protein ACRDL5_04015, partial [Solirubrobacteraceae bacterium]
MQIAETHTTRALRRIVAGVAALLALVALGGMLPSRAHAAGSRGQLGTAHGWLGAHAVAAGHRGCAVARGAATAVHFGRLRDSGR